MKRTLSTLLLLPSVLTASEGVSAGAEPLGFNLWGLQVTNSILTTWIVAAVILVGVRLVVGTPKLIPGKGQAVVEGLATGLRETLEPIVGKRMIGHVFPALCGFFTFILLMNWSGLLPGVGTLQVNQGGEWKELIRPANSDLNTTLALSVDRLAAST